MGAHILTCIDVNDAHICFSTPQNTESKLTSSSMLTSHRSLQNYVIVLITMKYFSLKEYLNEGKISSKRWIPNSCYLFIGFIIACHSLV